MTCTLSYLDPYPSETFLVLFIRISCTVLCWGGLREVQTPLHLFLVSVPCVEWRRPTNTYWTLGGRYCTRYIISFYLNSHLEGGKVVLSLFQGRKYFEVKQILQVIQLKRQTWDCRRRPCLKCCSSFYYTLLSLNSVINSFRVRDILLL